MYARNVGQLYEKREIITRTLSSLIQAIERNDSETVRDILCTIKGEQSSIILAYGTAIQNGNLDIVRYFIELGHVRVDDTNLMFGETVLMQSVRYGHLSVVKYLLQNDADVNLKSSQNGVTALHVCVSGPESPQNNIEILDCLLKTNKIDLEARDNDGNTPLMKSSGQIKYEEIKRLLQTGCDMYNMNQRRGHIAPHFCMLSHYLPNYSLEVGRCFRLFLECRINPDFRDQRGFPSIGYVIDTGNYEILHQLLYVNCDLNILYRDLPDQMIQFPPLIHAYQKMQTFIQILVASGCEIYKWHDILKYDLPGTDKDLNCTRKYLKPRKLKELCRISIRKQLGYYPHTIIDQIGLPKVLCDYILLKDVFNVELT
ncbi:uncharacterized protein LOC127719624 [Mytilus californianus]|uniref:uncharacterized protein LOC127719624 n=1 Tax=Mytilus californianus TaxID=6549 RepID=UPI0022468DC7|nr:uncharacterized protein LOC127719624 [Mytilus californianus]